jgi:hypothetical protein
MIMQIRLLFRYDTPFLAGNKTAPHWFNRYGAVFILVADLIRLQGSILATASPFFAGIGFIVARDTLVFAKNKKILANTV